MIDDIIKSIPGKFRWFDAVHMSGKSTPVSFKNGRLHSISGNENSGFGIRINRDGRTGFSFTNDIDSFRAAAERAYGLCPWGEEDSFTLPSDTRTSFEPYDPGAELFDPEREIAAAEKLIADLKDACPGISIDAGMNLSTGTFTLINSMGVEASYRESIYSASVSCSYVLKDGSRIETWESKSGLKPADFSDFRDTLVEKIGNALTVRPVDSGKYKVILPPRAFGSLVSFLASALNSVSVWKGISPLTGKMGEKIFSDSFSIVDDPCIEGSPYGIPFDGEGVNTWKRYLVKNGVVAGFINDLRHAARLGTDPTGNASRGYSSLPSPSFNGLCVEPGDVSARDMVAGLDRGIIAEQFIGLGQSNTITGDFSASLDLAYLVENGKVQGRVKDCMISGNIFELMKGEFAFSSERERRGSSVLPYVLVPAIDITA